MPDETPLTKAQIELLKQAIQEILEHLPIEDVKQLLREIKASLANEPTEAD